MLKVSGDLSVMPTPPDLGKGKKTPREILATRGPIPDTPDGVYQDGVLLEQIYHKPCVTTLMKAYDKRRLDGYGGHPSGYRIEGEQVYIATVDPTTGAPVLDVRLIDSLQQLYG